MDVSRQNERILLLIVSLIAFSGVSAVTLARNAIDAKVLTAVSILSITWLVISIVLQIFKHTGDHLLLPLAISLNAIGLTMILRLKPELFIMQSIWIFIGLIAFLLSAVLFRNLEQIAYYKYLCGFIGISLLLSAILFGVDIGGHKTWVIIGPIRFQPSEFAKIFIVLFLAAYLSERRELLTLATKHYGPFVFPHPRFMAPLILILSLSMLIVVLQRDMGSALLYFGIVIIMVYIVSGRLSHLLLGFILFLLGSVVCYKFYTHIQTRVDIWLNPWSDPNGKGYQIVQSLFALGSGGIMGTGLTYGYPTIIPEVHTDFIFSAIGEELGLLGAGAVILIYIIIIARAFRIATKTRQLFSMLVAAGLAVSMALQIFLIIGGVTKFFPLTGITLPFISYGGSSIVANYILIGILLAISEVKHYDTR